MHSFSAWNLFGSNKEGKRCCGFLKRKSFCVYLRWRRFKNLIFHGKILLNIKFMAFYDNYQKIVWIVQIRTFVVLCTTDPMHCMFLTYFGRLKSISKYDGLYQSHKAPSIWFERSSCQKCPIDISSNQMNSVWESKWGVLGNFAAVSLHHMEKL